MTQHSLPTVPYPYYDLSLPLSIPGVGALVENHIQEKISWCKQNFHEDDWDIDPLNGHLLFRTHDLYVWFVLQWDPQYLKK